ncbi:MAG: cytochrome c peroxidase [Thermodesulfobacteriota bacterium]
MKKVKIIGAVTLMFGCIALPAAAEKASVGLGKKLFANPGLGASQNAVSCTTCHPDGKGMAKAGANPNLTKMINMCIKGPLKGEALNEKTVAMESLKMYLESLAR